MTALAVANRPEIFILSLESGENGIEGANVVVQVMYVNKGRDIAKHIRAQVSITVQGFPLPTSIGLTGGHATDRNQPALESGMKDIFTVSSDYVVGQTTQRGTTHIVCIGCISYTDGGGRRRETGFCRKLEETSGRWEPVGNTEYEYAY